MHARVCPSQLHWKAAAGKALNQKPRVQSVRKEGLLPEGPRQEVPAGGVAMRLVRDTSQASGSVL